MTFPAHIRKESEGGNTVQTAAEHCRSSAQYAADVSIPALRQTAYLAGLLHDMGKFTRAFCDYITRAANGEDVQRGSVNHTFAGVRFVLERWYAPNTQSIKNIACELLAFAVGSHHGLFDCIDPDGKDGFLHRLTKEDTGYSEARENFLAQCADLKTLDALFLQVEQEVGAVCAQIRTFAESESQMRFYLSLLARLLLSAVIDGDRRDTAQFMLDVPRSPQEADLPALWSSCLQTVEQKIGAFPADSAIAQARRSISEQCRACASLESGIYRLFVPTGGGKTLSGLRYSLAAAAKHEKKRIFFVIPLLSILEQNAKVIREFVGDDSLILEHHSNLVQEAGAQDRLDENELLMETWDAPIIVTTLVQLLNTLFLGKTSGVRRMQALANSVIVIDEVQSVPRKMLSLFNLAMNFLSGVCGTTIVLCSATQPALEQAAQPIRYRTPKDMVPYDPVLWDVFRRTQISDRRRQDGYTAEDLSALAHKCLERDGSVLIICNTKAQARAVFTAVCAAGNARAFHLSTSMCMAHRIKTLAEINRCLLNKQRIICVSTQLVEAGVDFSFGCVIRVLAGLDNVVQAAGRCNRSGEFGRLCPVYIVNMHGENLNRLKEIKQAQQAMESVLMRFSQDAAQLGGELTSDAAVEAYYRRLYTDMPAGAQDYPVSLSGRAATLFALLSNNRDAANHCKTGGQHYINQAFKSAGDAFQVFEENTADILVPYGAGATLIADLGSDAAMRSFGCRFALLKQAKPYSVSVYEHERKRLADAGGLSLICDGTVLALQPDYYTESIGLDLDGNVGQFMEV